MTSVPRGHNNPFDAKHESRTFSAFERGYSAAEMQGRIDVEQTAMRYKSKQADEFVAALYLLAQEYGGGRFVYSNDEQEKLEAYSERIVEAARELDVKLTSIRTLR